MNPQTTSPIPGDPKQVRRISAQYATVATRAEQILSRLRAIETGIGPQIWRGEAANGFTALLAATGPDSPRSLPHTKPRAEHSPPTQPSWPPPRTPPEPLKLRPLPLPKPEIERPPTATAPDPKPSGRQPPHPTPKQRSTSALRKQPNSDAPTPSVARTPPPRPSIKRNSRCRPPNAKPTTQ
jgi:hypothetical protein